MTRDEFNQKLQWVQEIELAKGFKILQTRTHYKDDKLVEASYASPEGIVFRQTDPFTDHSEYWVDDQLLGSIIYRDLWS